MASSTRPTPPLMYPQGHGDAWGHYPDRAQKYYELLRHPNYTWVPRAEPIAVAGAPVVVDYYDERRFAIAAANKAKMGAEIMDLTYRKHYADPESQEYVDTAVDSSDQCDVGAMPGCNRRAWGVADWARRAGQGAYFDWVVANAIVPPEDDRYTDVRKIDRTTVLEIARDRGPVRGSPDQAGQRRHRRQPAGAGAGRRALRPGSGAHQDHAPARKARRTSSRSTSGPSPASSNAAALFDYANEMKIAQRDAQNEQWDFETSIIDGGPGAHQRADRDLRLPV